jgi:hypothetical protein
MLWRGPQNTKLWKDNNIQVKGGIIYPATNVKNENMFRNVEKSILIRIACGILPYSFLSVQILQV